MIDNRTACRDIGTVAFQYDCREATFILIESGGAQVNVAVCATTSRRIGPAFNSQVAVTGSDCDLSTNGVGKTERGSGAGTRYHDFIPDAADAGGRQ